MLLEHIIITSDQCWTAETDEGLRGFSGEESAIDARVHQAIDLLSAIIAHGEAARRRFAPAGGAEPRACVLARWLVASAFHLNEQLRAPGVFADDGAFSSRFRASLGRVRAGANQFFEHIRRQRVGDAGLQDALRIVAIVRRLESLMKPESRVTRLPPLLATSACAVF